MLQVKILKALYYNHLKDKVEGFGDEVISSDQDIVYMYFDNLPDSLKLLGDVLCKHIPNEKTLRYSQNDVNMWAGQLLELLKKNGNL